MTDEIKKLVKENKLVIGTNATLKKLKSNKARKVWLSSNIPGNVKEDILHYANLNNVEVETLNIPNDEFGVLCKKQFSVSAACMGD